MLTVRRQVGVRELKAHASEILREVEATGEEVVITVRGRAVARLKPFTDLASATDGMGGQRGAYPDEGPYEWSDFEEAKRIWHPRPLSDD